MIMSKIDSHDIEVLETILDCWNSLSNEPEAFNYMTDSCHIEYEEGLALLEKLKILEKKHS